MRETAEAPVRPDGVERAVRRDGDVRKTGARALERAGVGIAHGNRAVSRDVDHLRPGGAVVGGADDRLVKLIRRVLPA